VFVELNQTLISEFYSDNEYKTLFGRRIIAIDGSTLQLPTSDEVIKKYGVNNPLADVLVPMGRTSFAYDLLNEITLHALIAPYKSSEKDLAISHLRNIAPIEAKDLYIFDRGYPATWLIFFHVIHGKDFLMRCSTSFIEKVNGLVKGGNKDALFELSVKELKTHQISALRKLVPDLDMDLKVVLRLVVVMLNTGEMEILITTLTDRKSVKYDDFLGFYHRRWGVEENYKFHKTLMEIENFSGETAIAVEQDFYATILVANIRSLLAEEAMQELMDQGDVKQKSEYKINKNISLGLLKDKIVKALLSPKVDLEEFCDNLKEQMKKSLILVRNGREFERIKKSGEKSKFCMTRRRAL
jgi:hypothetical protein